MAYEVTASGVKLTVITDIACHLWMRWSHTPWDVHLVSEPVRGTQFSTKPYYCIVAYEDNEQAEAGDTLTHTFTKEPWASCETRYFHFWGEIGGLPCPSESCLFQYHRVAPPWGPPVTVRYYTDPHPETWSVDGYVGELIVNSTWAFLVGAPGNRSFDDRTYNACGYYNGNNPNTWHYLYRIINLFDTRLLPAGCNITSAKLAFKTESLFNTALTSPAFNIFSSNPGNNAFLVPADYTTLGSVKLSTDVPLGDFVDEAWTEFPLNAAGLAAITKAGITKLGLREVNYELPNIPPPWIGTMVGTLYRHHNSNALLVNVPYLEVTYREPA